MGLLRLYLRTEAARLARSGVRLSVIGRRDRIAFDYSARAAILDAASRVAGPDDLTQIGFSRLVAGETRAGDVDLVIRTGGEKRLSDFLLWESAYAELHFTDRMWPDFGADDLRQALEDFRRRQRRFGSLPAQQAA